MTPGSYQRLELDRIPTEADLDQYLSEGWRFVALIPSTDRYIAFFERASLAAAQGALLSKSIHDRIADALRTTRRGPELQRLADGIGHLQTTFYEILQSKIGEEEVNRLASEDAEMADLVADLKRLGSIEPL